MDSLTICRDKCQAWCCKNRAIVFTIDGTIKTDRSTCDKLKDNMCTIYENRPDGCRNYECPLLAYFERIEKESSKT